VSFIILVYRNRGEGRDAGGDSLLEIRGELETLPKQGRHRGDPSLQPLSAQ